MTSRNLRPKHWWMNVSEQLRSMMAHSLQRGGVRSGRDTEMDQKKLTRAAESCWGASPYLGVARIEWIGKDE